VEGCSNGKKAVQIAKITNGSSAILVDLLVRHNLTGIIGPTKVSNSLSAVLEEMASGTVAALNIPVLNPAIQFRVGTSLSKTNEKFRLIVANNDLALLP